MHFVTGSKKATHSKKILGSAPSLYSIFCKIAGRKKILRQAKRKQWFSYWLVLLLIISVLLAYPISTGFSRLVLAFLLAVVLLSIVASLWRYRKTRYALLFSHSLLAIFLLSPGKTVDRDALRRSYLDYLQSYEGTRYVWGGENSLGIDCSGLVRRSLIHANVTEGLQTLNPALLRTALQMWWYDCSAKALRDEYQHLTQQLFLAENANAIETNKLHPGDLAVTASGIHIFAYLGEKRWIEASPKVGKVICIESPQEIYPLTAKVYILRWRQLEESE